MDRVGKPYRHSIQEARVRGEVSEWRDSYRANVACKKAIESAIRENFDGSHLRKELAQSVIDQFGMERVAYVLANTLQIKDWDERFSPVNREWFGRITVPPDEEHNYDFAVDSHSTVLDGFMDQFRSAWQKLQQEQTRQGPQLTMQ